MSNILNNHRRLIKWEADVEFVEENNLKKDVKQKKKLKILKNKN